jgi:hypothetical protein
MSKLFLVNNHRSKLNESDIRQRLQPLGHLSKPIQIPALIEPVFCTSPLPAGKPIRIFDETSRRRRQLGSIRHCPCKVFQIVGIALEHRAVAKGRKRQLLETERADAETPIMSQL